MANPDKRLLADYESDTGRIRLHVQRLEETLRWCADRWQELAETGESQKRTQLMTIAQRARLKLAWLKRLS